VENSSEKIVGFAEREFATLTRIFFLAVEKRKEGGGWLRKQMIL
jgi:hypothetical protein